MIKSLATICTMSHIFMPIVIFSFLKCAAPAVPGPITFKSATHSLLHMAWTPPRGIVDRYIIGICEADQIRSSTACDTYQVEVNSSITDFRCIKLKTSTRYNITLTAKSDTLISRLRWVIKSTTSHCEFSANSF